MKASVIPLYATSPSARFRSCSRVFTTSNGFTTNAEVAPAPMPANREHQNTASPAPNSCVNKHATLFKAEECLLHFQHLEHSQKNSCKNAGIIFAMSVSVHPYVTTQELHGYRYMKYNNGYFYENFSTCYNSGQNITAAALCTSQT
jgi:hypothetical protein